MRRPAIFGGERPFEPFSHHRTPAELPDLTDHEGRPGLVDPVTNDPVVELAHEDDPLAAPPLAADGRPPRPAPPAVVTVRPRKGSSWAARRVNVTERPQQIAGKLLGRVAAVVLNTGPSEATLGPDDGVTPGTHWPLGVAGSTTAERKFENTGAIWAVTAAGTVTTLAVLVEYETDTGGA